jgi:hypothetical protein
MHGPTERGAPPAQGPRTLTPFAPPADCTVPWVGRFCAELGSRMPPTVLASASSALTNTRSPTGVTVLTCSGATGGRPERELQGPAPSTIRLRLACRFSVVSSEPNAGPLPAANH